MSGDGRRLALAASRVGRNRASDLRTLAEGGWDGVDAAEAYDSWLKGLDGPDTSRVGALLFDQPRWTGGRR